MKTENSKNNKGANTKSVCPLLFSGLASIRVTEIIVGRRYFQLNFYKKRFHNGSKLELWCSISN